MNKKLLSVFIVIVLAIFTGCNNSMKEAVGLEEEIIVVSDSVEYEYFSPALTDIYSKVIMTPQAENLFDLKRVSLNFLESVKNKKNIIIIAPLDSKSKTSEYINSLVNDEVRSKIQKDSVFVINKYDLWAKNQVVMILTAPNKEMLNYLMLKNQDDLLYYIRKVSDKRIGNSLFSEKHEKKEMEAVTLFKYGWMMYGQIDFMLTKEAPEDNFVWFRREVNSGKERFIFVHWIDNINPDLIKKDTIYSIRNRLTNKYYRTTDDENFVEIADDYLTTRVVNFNGKYALFTQGLWRYSNFGGGGPFINYTFYDEKQKRIYMIDASLFAPKYFKRSMIQQLDVLISSFKTINEVDKVKIAELKEISMN